jgi:hypothetical protein
MLKLGVAAGQALERGQGAFSMYTAILACVGNAPLPTPMVNITIEMNAATFISVVLIVLAALRSANR